VLSLSSASQLTTTATRSANASISGDAMDVVGTPGRAAQTQHLASSSPQTSQLPLPLSLLPGTVSAPAAAALPVMVPGWKRAVELIETYPYIAEMDHTQQAELMRLKGIAYARAYESLSVSTPTPSSSGNGSGDNGGASIQGAIINAKKSFSIAIQTASVQRGITYDPKSHLTHGIGAIWASWGKFCFRLAMRQCMPGIDGDPDDRTTATGISAAPWALDADSSFVNAKFAVICLLRAISDDLALVTSLLPYCFILLQCNGNITHASGSGSGAAMQKELVALLDQHSSELPVFIWFAHVPQLVRMLDVPTLAPWAEKVLCRIIDADPQLVLGMIWDVRQNANAATAGSADGSGSGLRSGRSVIVDVCGRILSHAPSAAYHALTQFKRVLVACTDAWLGAREALLCFKDLLFAIEATNELHSSQLNEGVTQLVQCMRIRLEVPLALVLDAKMLQTFISDFMEIGGSRGNGGSSGNAAVSKSPRKKQQHQQQQSNVSGFGMTYALLLQRIKAWSAVLDTVLKAPTHTHHAQQGLPLQIDAKYITLPLFGELQYVSNGSGTSPALRDRLARGCVQETETVARVMQILPPTQTQRLQGMISMLADNGNVYTYRILHVTLTAPATAPAPALVSTYSEHVLSSQLKVAMQWLLGQSQESRRRDLAICDAAEGVVVYGTNMALTGCSIDSYNFGNMSTSNSTNAGTYSSVLAIIDGLVGVDTVYAKQAALGNGDGDGSGSMYNTSILLQSRKLVHQGFCSKYQPQTLQSFIIRSSSCASQMRANLRLLANQLGTCNGTQWFLGASPPSAHDITYSIKHSQLSFGAISAAVATLASHVPSDTPPDNLHLHLPSIRVTPQFTAALHDIYMLGGSVLSFGCSLNAIIKNKHTAQALVSHVLLTMPHSASVSSGTSSSSSGGSADGDSGAMKSASRTWNAVQGMISRAESIAPIPEHMMRGDANRNTCASGGGSSSGSSSSARKGPIDMDVQALFASAGNAELLAQAPVTWGAYM